MYQLKLSSLLQHFRQSYKLKNQASFWFGGILSTLIHQIKSLNKINKSQSIQPHNNIENQQQYQIKIDISTQKYSEFLKIINTAFIQALQFYPQQQPTDQFYKFLSFCYQLIQHKHQSSQQQQQQKQQSITKINPYDYNLILSKCTLYNTLIVYSLKSKQYSNTLTLLEQLNKYVSQGRISKVNQIYLCFYSNYLVILRKVQPNMKINTLVNQIKSQLEDNLKFIYCKIIQRIQQNININNNNNNIININTNKTHQHYNPPQTNRLLTLLIIIFKQHPKILSSSIQQSLTQLINQIFTNNTNKKLLSYSSSKNSLSSYINTTKSIQKVYNKNIIKSLSFSMKLSYYQFNHYFTATFNQMIIQNINSIFYGNNKKKNKNIYKRIQKTRDDTQRQQNQQKLQKIQKMLQRSIQLLQLKKNNQTNTISYNNQTNTISYQTNQKQQQTQMNSLTNKTFITNRFRRLNNLSQTQKKINNNNINNNKNNIDKNQQHRTIDISSFHLPNSMEYINEKMQYSINSNSNSNSNSNKQRRSRSRKSNRLSIQNRVAVQKISPSKMQKSLQLSSNNYKIALQQPHHQPIRKLSSFLSTTLPHPPSLKPSQKSLSHHHSVIFKYGSIFIQTNSDGILLSDYTKQNKKYIQWNTVSLILSRLQYKFIFQQYLKFPLVNQYDIVRILQLYLSKSQNNNIAIFEYPNIMLQLNQFVRIYPQCTKFSKLVLMNIYDTSQIQGFIDCYFQQFQHFFKKISTNGIVDYLNIKILHLIQIQTNIDCILNRKNQIFCIEMLKKKDNNIKMILEQQFNVTLLQHVINDKQFYYKSLFLLKGNKRLYSKINYSQQNNKLNIQTNPGSLGSFYITVQRVQCPYQQNQQNTKNHPNFQQNPIDFQQHINSNNFTFNPPKKPSQNDQYKCQKKQQCPIQRKIQIPFIKIFPYFPLYDMTYSTYLSRYGRMIFAFFNNFQQLSNDTTMSSLTFQITSHVYLIDMIQIGRYYTPVSIELIGTKKQIFAMLIRYNFLPANKDIVTLLMNPYPGFLAHIINMKIDEKKKILRKMLIKQSIKQTYQYFQKNKKLNQINSLIQYLQNGLGII